MSTAVFAKEASLKTLSVTIQALVVSGKQMTLAVFRQLPFDVATERDGSLKSYKWWGLVRYKIKDEGELWAVAEHDGHLYRCEIRLDLLEDYPDYPVDWALALNRERDKKLAEVDAKEECSHITWRYSPHSHMVYDGNREKIKEKIQADYERVQKRDLRDCCAAHSYRTLLNNLEQLFIAV